MVTSCFFWHISNIQLCTDCYGLGGWTGNTHKHYYYKTVNNCRILSVLNLIFLPLIMGSLSSHEQSKFILTVVSIRIKAV